MNNTGPNIIYVYVNNLIAHRSINISEKKAKEKVSRKQSIAAFIA